MECIVVTMYYVACEFRKEIRRGRKDRSKVQVAREKESVQGSRDKENQNRGRKHRSKEIFSLSPVVEG